MADSLMARLRARLEEIQVEMQPEAGFNRRAYGYGEDGGEDGADATFEEVALEEESPWRRPGSGSPRPVSEADRTAGGRSAARGSQAAPEPVPGRLRPKAPASFLPVGARTGGATGQDNPPPSATPGEGTVREPPVRSRDPVSARGGREIRDSERKSPRRPSRLRRFRRRLRHPDSFRELFLLREVIDRPIALRPRPRGRRPS